MDAMRHQTQGHTGYGQQGGYGYQQPLPEQHRGMQGGFMDEIREIAYGRKPIPEELKAVVCAIVKEQTDGMLGQFGYSQQGMTGYEGGQHQRYKEALEELREAPNPIEAEKKFDQFFTDLTPEDKKVLKQLINRPSTKKLAQMVNMQPDRFMEVKRGLEHKLK